MYIILESNVNWHKRVVLILLQALTNKFKNFHKYVTVYSKLATLPDS